MVYGSSFVSSKALRSNQLGTSQFRDITPSRNVCRNLFGPVDHEELRKDIEKHKREHAEAEKREYNFDFENEKPLEGRYLWEKLPSTCRKSSAISNCKSESSTTEKPLVSEAETASYTNSAKNHLSDASRKVVENENHKITEFFRAKKRKLDEFLLKEDQTTSSEAATPRLKQFKRTEIKTGKCDHHP